MKILKLSFLCLGVVLSLGLSHAAAQTACPKIDAGGTVYGNYDCRLRHTCGGWCYYDCTCTNLFPGYTCDDVLREAGFEVNVTPDCTVV